MIAKWKKSLDNKRAAGALLTDLSKAFHCLNYGLLIAKLDTYRLDHPSLNLINSYLTNRSQRVKVNSNYSSSRNPYMVSHKDRFLDPCYYVYLCDLFFFLITPLLLTY